MNRNTRAAGVEIETWKKQTDEGDQTALARIRAAIKGNPELIERLHGDVCRNAERLNSEAVGCERAWMAAAVEAQLDLLRSDLAAECPAAQPSVNEQMLIDRVVVCWLTLYSLEQEAAVQYKKAPGKRPLLDIAIDRAHRRFLSAIEVLARYRRLNRPLELDLKPGTQINTGSR